MYPQNTTADVEEADSTTASHAQAAIPVGFPGRTQAYRRQHGPEGEEQDIIGVDGHTEQLPPYSEYPEDGVPKHIVIPGQTVTAAPASTTLLNVPFLPARQQSMSDATPSANPQGFASMEQMESNDASLASSGKKSWADKSWKERRKTKFCGVPFWWILLSICVLAFIAVVLGGAIGGFMGSQKDDGKKSHQNMPSSTSLFDASPIPTSSTGSPPSTGTYALSLGPAEATQSACLTDQSYASAWDCDLANSHSFALSIENPPSGAGSWEGACLIDTT